MVGMVFEVQRESVRCHRPAFESGAQSGRRPGWMREREKNLMSRIAPKPIVCQVVRTWDVPPAMRFAVVEDIESRLWIEESCPVGTHYWTVEQAAELPAGARTRRALEEAVALAC